MKLAIGALLSVLMLVSSVARCGEGPLASPVLIYRCSGHCEGLWWDEYRHQPLRVEEYWRPAPFPDGRIGSAYAGRFLEALGSSGNRVETIWDVSATNVALELFFVDAGSKLIIVSTDGGDSCATTTVYLHDLHWPPKQSEVLLEPAEVMCNGYPVRGKHSEAMHLPEVGEVVPSEDGTMLANSFTTGISGPGRTQLVDVLAKKVVAETDGTLIGRCGPRAFYVVEPLYTERYHHIRDEALKEFSLDGAKIVGRANGIEHVVRGSDGRLVFGGTVQKVDTAQPHYDKSEKQVLEDEFRPGVKATSQGVQRPAFPCQVLNSLNAWQEASGEVVVAVEEQCDGKHGYALYRLPKP